MRATYISAGVSRRSSPPASPTLIANAAVNPGNFIEPVTLGPLDTTGANFIAIVGSTYDTGVGDNRIPPLFADLVGGTVANTLFSVTSITQSGSDMILNGSFAGGGSNAYAGKNFFVAVNGDSGGQPTNCGGFPCTASSTTTITLTNSAGITDATTYKAIITQNLWHYLIRTLDYGNVFMFYAYNAAVGSGHTFVMNTTNLGGDGGAFALQAWSNIKSSSNPLVPGSYMFGRGTGVTTDSVGAITSASYSGTSLTISGNWQLGDYASLIGTSVTLSGFTGSSSANNGTWTVTSGNSTQLVLTVISGYNGLAGTPVLKIPVPGANTVIIAGLGGRNNYGTKSIDSGFTITDSYNGSSQFAQASMAYKLSSGTAGEAPFWTTATSTVNMDMCIAAFEHA